MKLKNLLTVCCLLMIAVSASAEKSSKTGNVEELKDGVSRNSVIELNEDFGIPSKMFSFRVPKNAYAVRLSISGAAADLDLFIKKGSKIDDFAVVDYLSETENYNENLFISRQSGAPLETGIYYIAAAYQYDYLPIINGKTSEEIEFSINFEIIKAEAETTLRPGEPRKMMLKPENGMFAVAAVDIPSGTDAFRIDVFDTNSDVDIFAALRTPAKSRDEAIYAAESMLGSESLIVKGYSNNRLVTGRYYISFVDQLAREMPQELSVVLTLDDKAPELLNTIPVFPEPGDSLESALMSTVEIISDNGKGSGCIVSKEGHIITNWHVIKGADGNPSENNYVAVSLSNYLPPAEVFSAEVVDYNEKLDLALLKINSGRYGQSLPYGYEFPYFNLGNPSKLRIGQPLSIIGYPEVGGTGSRTSITFTSGYVSGFEASAEFTLIKTDALISSGNSGGAVVDAYYELLGFPGYIMDINNDKMGYIYPVSSLPFAWTIKLDAANR